MLKHLYPLLVLLLVMASDQAGAQDQARPNIIYIMADDMGYADLGCFGSTAIQTPHIDAMAERGMRFTDSYAGCTVCAPTRSTLMTGYHIGHTYMRLNSGGCPIRDEDITVAEVLHDAGYRTGGFGKWGLGDLDTTGVPERQGFDTFFGYYHQIHAHYFCPDYLIHNSEKVHLPGNEGFYDRYPHNQAGTFPRVDPQTGQTRVFSQDLIFEQMKTFIRESAASGEPFFCYAPWTPPHAEYRIPDDDPAWLLYANADWPMQARVHAAFCSMTDRQVGETFALLEELGIAENTIVFFVSDNGGAQRFEGTLNSCGPFRGFKRSLYEGGLRVPMVVTWPGHIEAGSTSDLPNYSPDVMPTLTQLAGTPTPEGIDGLSILPTLLGQGEQAMHDYLYWEYGQTPAAMANGPSQAVRQGNWKAVRQRGSTSIELYDLDTDPGEAHNLADEHPQIAARLGELMDAAHSPMLPQREPERIGGRPYR